jgi:hypothetical protein
MPEGRLAGSRPASSRVAGSLLAGSLLAALLCACAAPPQATGPSSAASSASPVAASAPGPIVGAAPTRPPGARVVAAGCGNAPVYNGSIPPWASVNAPAGLDYVIASPDLAMGYLFSYPLRSGPEGNKILWYVRAPRGGQPLEGDGHPLGAAQPTAHFSKPDDSGPGEIYPSGVYVPTPGCWRFHLAWNGYAADVDLLFSP